MNSNQIIGLIGSTIVIVGCFLPIANVPILGGINYMFPPGGEIGDGVFVAGLAILGMLGAVRGGSLLTLVSSVLGALIFGYTISNLMEIYADAEETGGLAGLMMSTVGLGSGAAAIAVGLVLMFISSLLPKPAESNAGSRRVKCPACAELVQPDAIVCRYCGNDIETKNDPYIGNN